MKIRELRTKDTFALSRILRRIEFDRLVALFKMMTSESEADEKKDNAMEVGLALFELVVTHYADLENDLTAFLGELTGMTPAEFAEVPLLDFKDVLLQLARAPEMAGFFAYIKQGTA